MRQLYIDIETAPNLAYVWGLFKQNVGINQIVQAGEVISFAAKWHGEKKTEFVSIDNAGREGMLLRAHEYLSEADIVVHYNGTSFDVPWLQGEFLVSGMAPPAPFQQIDLLRVVRKTARFPSNKLDYVSQALGIGEKVHHSGFDLWVRCMAGEKKAWREMEKYNKQDVVLLEDLYLKLRPWIKDHPNIGLIEGDSDDRCPNCAGVDLRREGFAYTKLGRYQRYQCRDCGTWSRAGRRADGADLRGVA